MARTVKDKKPFPPGKKGFFFAALSAAGTGIKVVLKVILLLPLLAGMVWVNYTVDRSGLFQGERYEREVALALIEGKNLTGYDQMNEREIYTLLSQNLTVPYDTIALGSSRVMPLRQDMVGGSFLNCGMSNADYRDILSTYYLFEKAGMKPKNLILCVDPGILYNDAKMLHPYSNAALYNEFLQLKLGFDTGYEEPATSGKYDALWDPSYLQGNLKYLTEEQAAQDDPQEVEGNLYEQPTNVKLGDGSVLYSKAFRTADIETINQRALQDLTWLERMIGYQDIDPSLLEVFTRFLGYLEQQNVNVIFLLVPFHPLCYDYAFEKYDVLTAMFKMEDWLREYAVTHNLALYGTYNPLVGRGFEEIDFYDGLHIKPEAMAEIFPGIKTAQAAVKSGQATNPQIYGGEIVSYDTALRIVEKRYEIAPPHDMRPQEDARIDGYNCYVLGRYENNSEDATLLAQYAVAKTAGIIYRLDTEQEQWVIDYRFANT